ncbi:MAG: hypothetical protein AB9842_08475 [Bacteroidales bacterium]
MNPSALTGKRQLLPFHCWLVLLVILLFTLSVKSQNIGYVLVEGIVYVNNKPVSNVNIKVFLRDSQIGHVRSEADGKFEFELPFNEKYQVEVSKFGLVTKRFTFNTELPAGEREDQIYSFRLHLDLFPPFEEVDMSLLDNPMAYISYDSEIGIYGFNLEEATETVRKVRQLEKRIYSILSMKARLFRLEMNNAEAAFNKGNYPLARADFQKALNVYPVNTARLYIDVDYIKARIKAIDQLISELNIAEQSKLKKKAYDDAVMMAKKASLNNRMDEAINNYNAALAVNPADSSSQEKLEKIKQTIKGEIILSMISKPTLVENGSEVRMRFLPIKPQLKKGNYIYLRVKNKGDENARLNIRFGTDNDLAGNFVVTDLSKTEFKEHYIKISSSERWTKWQINWISLFPDGGDIEVEEMKMTKTE